MQQSYQWRPVLTDLLPPGRPFLCNCVSSLHALVTIKDILQKPLSYLASQIRLSIKEQSTREQVEAYASLIREDTNRAPVLFGESSMRHLSFTNWTKANMYGVDLSAAAVRHRETPLMSSYVQGAVKPYKVNDSFYIIGDASGNYWISGHRIRALWKKMAKGMAAEHI